MLPGNGIGDADKTCYPGSPEYKFKYGSEGLNTSDIKEYIRNPHKFNIKLEMDGKYYNLWSTDNERIDANDDKVIKSVYDPSPVGYSLPASNAFTGFTTTGLNTGNPGNPAEYNVKGNFDKGWYFYTKHGKAGNTFFFPASGLRYNNSGKLTNISVGGYYKLSSPGSNKHGRFLDFYSSLIYTFSISERSWGHSLRSAEGREFECVCYCKHKKHTLYVS